MTRFTEWLTNKWRNDTEPEQRKKNYEQALHYIMNTPQGQIVLEEWMKHYCTISYVPSGRCCDTAYNEGLRAFPHAIFETLDRMDNPSKRAETKVEVE